MTHLAGHYAPNIPGAATLAEARPLYIDGRHITAEVYEWKGVIRVSIWAAGKMIHDDTLPQDISERAAVTAYIVKTAFGDGKYTFDGRGFHTVPGNVDECSQCGALIPLSQLGAHSQECEKAKTRLANEGLAETVWQTHYAIACSADADLCSFNTPVYRASQKLLLSTIRTVYGLSALKAQRVYDVLIDSGESVYYSVQYVKTHRESTVYSR